MSPIGRVFIVLNLVLAGVFVGFAGTYLQQASDWKLKYNEKVTESDARIAELEQLVTQANTTTESTKSKLANSESRLSNSEAEVANLRNENARLLQQYEALLADVKTIKADYSTVASSVESAFKLANESHSNSLKAQGERDVAVRDKETAVSDLNDANAKIARLESSVEARDARIAELGDEIKEQGILLAMVRTRFPGILAGLQPDLKGVVNRVDLDGRLVTLALTDNPANVEVQPGVSFAIYAGDTYKGEAMAESVVGNSVMCRVASMTNGSKINVGDQAATNTR